MLTRNSVFRSSFISIAQAIDDRRFARLLSIKDCRAICGRSCSDTRRIRLRKFLTDLVRDESGVTAIEYALIAALIAVAAIAAFTLVGTNLSTTFSTIAGKV
jgi:pilus assembly protein Flp/PilA